MKLETLLKSCDKINNFKFDHIHSSIELTSINMNSSNVEEGSLFLAIKGARVDGNDFINDALAKGAKAILTSDYDTYLNKSHNKNIAIIYHINIDDIIGKIFSTFYNDIKPKNLLAVTGTNGKSSVVNFYQQLSHKLGIRCASIGTIGVIYDNDKHLEDIQMDMTTPNQEILYKIFAKLKDLGIENVIMEASSHGIHQGRIDHSGIKIAAFTNLTRDHLDYHKTLDNYFNAKARLFSEVLEDGAKIVVNADSEKAEALSNIAQQKNHHMIQFGFNAHEKGNNIKIISVSNIDYSQLVKISFKGKQYEFKLNLVGVFQVKNVVCAVSMLMASGVNINDILPLLEEITGVKGRAERVSIKEKSDVGFFVDYAHSPDGLENILTNLKKITKNKLIVVFGCGGNRDKGKREMMGKIANDIADFSIITDDNPRTEDPSLIRKSIISAFDSSSKFIEIADREKAILYAKDIASSGDIVLIAGKGHEDYQITKEGKSYFSDSDVLYKSL